MKKKLDYLTNKIVSADGIELDKLIMGVENRDDVIIEHIDGDALNCQKSNLRIIYLNKN